MYLRPSPDPVNTRTIPMGIKQPFLSRRSKTARFVLIDALSWNSGDEHEGRKGLVAGTAGGLAGAVTMSLVLTVLKKVFRDKGSLRQYWREQRSEGGQSKEESPEHQPPTVTTANYISHHLLPHEWTNGDPNRAGEAVHYTFGLITGAFYGLLAEYDRRTTRGAGIPFGLAVWLVADETMLPLLWLTKPPTRIPPAIHAKAFFAHVIYGLTTEVTRKFVRTMLAPRGRRNFPRLIKPRNLLNS